MNAAVQPSHVGTFAASDGYPLHFHHYPAQGTARGELVCIHGIQSHGGWYDASCAYLAAQGWDVTFLDRRGSGLNDQMRGDTPSWRRLVADVAEFVRSRPQKPFLLAISWGGKIALTLERLYPNSTRGLVLVAPGLCPKVKPPLGQRLGIAWARLTSPATLFAVPLDDPELFTATPRWQAFIRNDPLSLRNATARLLVSSVVLDVAAKRSCADVRVPVLLLLAGQDRIIDNGKTKAYCARLASPDRTVIEYPQAHHTLEFEPDPTPFFADVAAWLAAQAGRCLTSPGCHSTVDDAVLQQPKAPS
jgi:alpha-beta hydrolase superfamily lysophospholipase